MTESDVLKDLQKYKDILEAKVDLNVSANAETALSKVTKAIEEIQAYRAIGTVEELQAIKSSTQLVTDILAEYSSIGTIEAFKALKEQDHDCIIKHLSGECSYKETGCSDCKSKWKIKDLLEKSEPKKPIISEEFSEEMKVCPICGMELMNKQPYCEKCGQKLDWQ